MDPRGTVLVASGPWDPEPWATMVRALDPGRTVAIWPDVPDPAAIRYVLAWKPPAEALAGLPNLAAIFSLGAGVDHIVLGPPLPDVPVVRIISPDLTKRMTEWVTLQVLLHHRRQRDYDRQQRERVWRELPQPPASAVRVGVMGMGELGRASAAMLRELGFQVAGWSRRPSSVAGVESFHGNDRLDAFLGRTDILVALLPLTPETRGILSMPLFAKLARSDALAGGPVLVNAGRGGLQVEADILAAIEAGILGGASLDVFATEPLDPASPLWASDRIVITPHVAGPSEAEELAAQIVDQIRAFEAGRPLRNVIDRAALY
ncbi:MAG TPA: glyoxylate/hydroxypyruvate reductase A [Bauldia sp.]|nr:glyoxylate/hydroxypyruvate reductase A [Bauldia sp.]